MKTAQQQVTRLDSRLSSLTPAGQQDQGRLLASRDSLGDLDVLHGPVEIVFDAGVVRIAGGVEAWIHPGNVIAVEVGAIVHLAAGATLEEEPDPHLLATGQITITTWRPEASTPHQVTTASAHATPART